MKKVILFVTLGVASMLNAQVVTPKASPAAKFQQKVGLADIQIEYARPGAKGRVVFGDLIPYGQMWRLGANENTKITSSEALIFGKDTLAAGTYALFAKPGELNWELYFYADYANWGLPEPWDPSKVKLMVVANAQKTQDYQENLTIQIDALNNNGANIVINWENTKVTLPFSLNTKAKVLASIDKTMAGPSANDYHAAATYYFNENLDLEKALEWSTKAVEMRGNSAYWMTRLKAQLQAANGDYKGAIETAKISIEAAKADGDDAYVRSNEKSIAEWSKKR
ncbi:MAG: DUF2911 domain-containing protein [Sphingomonadales bacterium]|nr:DUF2911 domain-containing protein [Sphingomonadales bacterium]